LSGRPNASRDFAGLLLLFNPSKPPLVVGGEGRSSSPADGAAAEEEKDARWEAEADARRRDPPPLSADPRSDPSANAPERRPRDDERRAPPEFLSSPSLSSLSARARSDGSVDDLGGLSSEG
jgi:hypothetical protein